MVVDELEVEALRRYCNWNWWWQWQTQVQARVRDSRGMRERERATWAALAHGRQVSAGCRDERKRL